jgi:hypothetical protein
MRDSFVKSHCDIAAVPAGKKNYSGMSFVPEFFGPQNPKTQKTSKLKNIWTRKQTFGEGFERVDETESHREIFVCGNGPFSKKVPLLRPLPPSRLFCSFEQSS